MSWNTDRSSATFTIVAALVLCVVVVGPVVADTTGVREGSTYESTSEEQTGDGPTPTTATTTTPTRNGTATPRTGTTTPSPTPRTPTTGNGTFVVTDLETPDSLRVGDGLDVTARVTNRASGNGTETLRYSFGGSTVASRTVTLGPGESTTVAFEVPFSDIESTLGSVEPGTYVHGVRNESGDGSARRLRVTPDVDLTLEAFDAPVEVSHGEPYIVLATVGNPGNTSITRRVSYEFAGQSVAHRAVTVAGRDDRQVAFEARLSNVEGVVGPVDNETTYGHGVVTGDRREGGAVRVVRGPSANASALALESFEVTDDVRPGESYRVDLSVRNVDTADFEGQLTYRVDGAIVGTEWTEVPIGERRTVGFRVRYEEVADATALPASQDTVHGVFVGDDAVVTRPVTVHVPLETETATPPPPTFAASGTPRASPAPRPTPEPTVEPTTPTGDTRCERGFFTVCGGTTMDETSLTMFGVLLSGFGIVYEMYRGRR